MKADAAMCLQCLVNALTRELAQHWARLAYERGATSEQLADAWVEWSRRQDEQVQTIVSHPSGGAA